MDALFTCRVNTPLFEAVFVSRDRQTAAAQMCLEHVRKIEDRARAEAARKQLDNFVCVHLALSFNS